MSLPVQRAALLSALAFALTPAAAGAAPSDLDGSFGTSGVTTTTLSSSAYAGDLIAQPDGKLVVVGSQQNGSPWDWVLTRYSANGVLDSGFGSGGKLVVAGNSSGQGGTAAVVDGSGNVDFTGERTGSSASVMVRQADSTGTLTGFLGGIPISQSTRTTPQAIAIQPDGKIVVAGEAFVAGHDRVFAARFNTNGSADTTFDNDGTADGLYLVPITACDDVPSADCNAGGLALATSGSNVTAIYVGGTNMGDLVGGRVFKLVPTAGSFAIDTSYGDAATPGAARIDRTAVNDVEDLLLTGDGKVVVAGYAQSGPSYQCGIARVLPSGAIDSGFGTGGAGRINLGGTCEATDLAQDGAGRFYVGGLTTDGAFFAGTASVAVGRFTSAGAADGAFASGGGAASSPGGSPSFANGIVMQDTKPVVAGGAGSPHSILLARYQGGDLAGGGAGSSGGGADTTAPSIAWTSPTDKGAVNSATPTFTGTSSNDPGDSVTIPIDLRMLSGGNFVNVPGYGAQVTATRTGTSWSVRLGTPLADGTYFARAYLNDLAGNSANGGNGAAILFRVDTKAPTLSIRAPADKSKLTDNTPIISGVAGGATGDLTTIDVTLQKQTAPGKFGPVRHVKGKRDGTYWSAKLPKLPNATWFARAYLNDDAGNQGFSGGDLFTIAKLGEPKNSGTFTVEGPLQVGEQVHVHATKDWKPAEDLDITYRWQACADKAEPTDCKWVSNQDRSGFYLLDSHDAGHRIRAAIYASNPDKLAPAKYTQLSSDPVDPPDQRPTPRRAPRIVAPDGTVSVNDVLKLDKGDFFARPAPLYGVRWQICRFEIFCDDVTDPDGSLHTDDTFKVPASAEGHKIKVVVYAVNRVGYAFAETPKTAAVQADRKALRRAAIVDAYLHVFGRQPTQAEIDHWMPRSETRDQLVVQNELFIEDNTSAAQEVVTAAYQQVYGHAPYTAANAAGNHNLADQSTQFANDVGAEQATGTPYDDVVTNYATALAKQAYTKIFFWAKGVSNRSLVSSAVAKQDVSAFVARARSDYYDLNGKGTRGENLWTDVALSNDPLHGAARTSYPGEGSPGSADRENCFGAVGPGCTGVPGLSDATLTGNFVTLDGRKMAYLKVTTAVGSILHDAMCRVYPAHGLDLVHNGAWCGDAPADPTELLPLAKIFITGAAEWNKATANTAQGRKWYESYGPYPEKDATLAMKDKHALTYSDDLRPAERQLRQTTLTRGGVFLGILDIDQPFPWGGVEIRSSLRLEAPAYTPLDDSDADFCHSHRFSHPLFRPTISGQRPYDVCA